MGLFFCLIRLIGYYNDTLSFQFLDVPVNLVVALPKETGIMRTQVDLAGNEIVALVFRRSVSDAEPDNDSAFVGKRVQVMWPVLLGVFDCSKFLRNSQRQFFRNDSSHLGDAWR
jgi:hypothetical protein